MTVAHDDLRAAVDEYAATASERGSYETRIVVQTQGVHVVSFTRPGGFSVLRLTASDAANVGTFIQIAGGGAMNVPAKSTLYQSILERHISMDWGGPFARTWPDGTVLFGTQLVLPSTLLSAGDALGFGFLFGMVDLFGDIARSIAVELLPRFGGELMDGSNPQQDRELFAALVGPGGPSIN